MTRSRGESCAARPALGPDRQLRRARRPAAAGRWSSRWCGSSGGRSRPISSRASSSGAECQASYHLDRVGLAHPGGHDLVIGDPRRPDLVARHAIIQMRLKWNGSFEVYRVFARGVRLRGRLVHGKVSWGQIDKLLPPPSNKPFQLPNFALDVADSSIALATPFGPVGVALEGNGKLSGGFKGRLRSSARGWSRAAAPPTNLRANVAVAVVARRPQIEGRSRSTASPARQAGSTSIAPRFDAKASFNEAFTSVDGSGRMAISSHGRRRQRPRRLRRRAHLQGPARPTCAAR